MITHSLSSQFMKARSKSNLGRNVLIIEDDADTAEALQVTLLYEGYGVRTVKNRDEAMLAIKQNLYHFILLDYFMPGVSAQEFISAVKVHSPMTQLVLITAAQYAQQKARELKLKHWLGKPILPTDLISLLQKIG